MPATTFKGLPDSGWHAGEVQAQEALGWANVSSASIIEDHLDSFHQEFHQSLAFLPLASLDAKGRPWASILVNPNGQRGFINSKNRYSLHIAAAVIPGDPLAENLHTSNLPLVAGVGVELLNRRRNKFGGYLTQLEVQKEKHLMHIDLRINSALGNCPKYINVRDLQARPSHHAKPTETNLEHNPHRPLPASVLAHISKVDSAYIASAYLPKDAVEDSHLGINHRGGRPGFLRIDPSSQSAIYLPDYSGNRFMQSVGNMMHTPLAGLALPDWTTGDVLYLTGNTRLYLGQEAKSIMRSVHGVLRVDITGYSLVREALPLVQVGATTWSEYNPPIRFLNTEPESGYKEGVSQTAQAQITSFRSLNDSLAVLSFKVTSPQQLDYAPGQYAVLDCSSFLHPSARRYRHMAARGQEQVLNDDGIRTWTITGWKRSEDGMTEMELTMRRKEGGLITPILFAFGQAVNEKENGAFHGHLAISFPLFGVAGNFQLPAPKTKQLWIADGVGISPFLAFIKHMDSLEDTVLFLLCRRADLAAFQQLLVEALTASGKPSSCKITIFVSDATEEEASQYSMLQPLFQHRAGRQLPKDMVQDVAKRKVLFCGTETHRASLEEDLASRGLPPDQLECEGFAF